MELEINFIYIFAYKKSFSKLGGIKMLKLDRRKLDLILAEKCYNLVDLTKKAGVSSALITKVVSGNYTLTTKTLGKIAKALEVKPQDLIQE